MSGTSGSRFALAGLEPRALMSASVAAELFSSSLDTGVPVGRASAALSASAVAPASPAGVTVLPYVHRVPATTPLTGAFNAAGTYSQPFGNPDAGPLFHFSGSGRKRSLGSFTMAGDVHGIGFVASGRFRGYVTFTCSQGTIDVRLLGPEQSPGPLPTSFAFKIVGGSGAYANASGKGELAVSASDATKKFVFRFNQA